MRYEPQPVSERKEAVTLLLILIYPLGLFFLWESCRYTRAGKVARTVVFGALFLALAYTLWCAALGRPLPAPAQRAAAILNPAATATAPAAVPAEAYRELGEGTYTVGTDIAPGTYTIRLVAGTGSLARVSSLGISMPLTADPEGIYTLKDEYQGVALGDGERLVVGDGLKVSLTGE